jgi:hypothetical protein
MKRTLLAAGAAALAMGLPATAALADGYNARPAYMQAKPRPKPAPRAQARPAPKPQKQARHAPRLQKTYKAHAHAAAVVQYEEFESVETSVTREVNGRVEGPYTSYSERYVAPHRGCHPQAPCGYSTGVQGYAHGRHEGGHHGAHVGGRHGAAFGGSGGHDVTIIRPGFEHGAMSGGVGYGVDGGPVYGASTVIIRPGGYGHGFGARSSSSASSYAHSSAQAHGSSSYSYGGSGHGGHGSGFGYGPTYGHGGHGYLGFKPGAYGQGVGRSGYGGCCR